MPIKNASISYTHPTEMKEAKSKHRAAHAKGLRLQRLAREWLEAAGWFVETAQNTIVWVKDKQWQLESLGNRGVKPALRPISTHHDFFGLWDLIAVWPPFEQNSWRRYVAFVQVTTLENVSHRRRTITASSFPSDIGDMILGWKGGRDGHFRVFRGPTFEEWKGECLRKGVIA